MMKTVVVLCCVFLLNGCSHYREIDWVEQGAAPLSKHACPNLSGAYRNLIEPLDSARVPGTFFGFVYSIVGNPPENRYAQAIRKKGDRFDREFFRTSWVELVHGEQQLEIILRDGDGEEQERIIARLNTDMTGCRAGALVLRMIRDSRRAEWGGGSVTFGENILRKLPNGAIGLSERVGGYGYGPVVNAPGASRGLGPETGMRIAEPLLGK